jgi:hypothetical protein
MIFNGVEEFTRADFSIRELRAAWIRLPEIVNARLEVLTCTNDLMPPILLRLSVQPDSSGFAEGV